MPDDAELLRRYARDHDEAAFGELVSRHFALVYSTARRELQGNAHRAEDVAQLVFTDLARKAPRLCDRRSLAGWLYLGTRHAAAHLRRTEQRRQLREHAAYLMNESNETCDSTSAAPAPAWDRLQPLLDSVVAQLGDADREAILLRFFAGRSLAEIGTLLQLSPDAAQKRVSRALEKMRRLFARRGIASTSAALGLALETHAAATAAAIPPGLALSVGAKSLAAAAQAGPASLAIFSAMSTTKVTFAAVAVALAITIARVTWYAYDSARAPADTVTSRLDPHIVKTVSAPTPAPKSAAAFSRTSAPASAPMPAPASASASTAPRPISARAVGTPNLPAFTLAPGMLPTAAWHNVGRATPEAAFQTELWAEDRQQVEVAAAMLTFDPAARERLTALIASLPEKSRSTYVSPEYLAALLMTGSGDPTPFAGLQVLSADPRSGDLIALRTRWQYTDGQVRENEWLFQRDADGWKRVLQSDMVEKLVHILEQESKPSP